MDSIPNDTIICFQYGLVNIGTNNLIIEDLNPSCSCSECYALDSIVLPNDTTQILMYINMKEKVGLNKVNTIVTLNTKTELYRHLKAKNGMVFVNSANEILMNKSEEINRVIYGNAETADCKGAYRSSNPCLKFYFENGDIVYDIYTNAFILNMDFTLNSRLSYVSNPTQL